MHILSKFVLVWMVLFIFGIVVYLLWKQRNRILLTAASTETFDSNPVDEKQESELNKINKYLNTTVVGTKSINKFLTASIKDFIIKSSWNTAYTGNYMNVNAIKYILSRGYRFIDFEVYMVNSSACIAYSEDSTNVSIKSLNTLTLDKVFSTIYNYGFTAPTPNPDDPLFVQLRIRTNDISVYNQIGDSIAGNLLPKLYTGDPITKKTKMQDLMGKIVLIIDTQWAPKYMKYPDCTPTGPSGSCHNLSQYVFMENGNGNPIFKYKYNDLLEQSTSPPTIMDADTGATSITVIRNIEPDPLMNSMNPTLMTFVEKYGVQFPCVQLNTNYLDSKLIEYETKFSDWGYGCVPVAIALRKFRE